jgi:hypothetical protein
MLLTNRHSGKMLTYATLSFIDLYLTYTLVQNSGGLVYESNPIANAWLARYGWAGLAVFKLAAMLLVACLAVYISFYRPQTADRILRFACCAVAFVVVYSFWLVNSCTGRYPSDERGRYDRTMMVAAVAHRPTGSASTAPRFDDLSKPWPRISPARPKELPLRKATL